MNDQKQLAILEAPGALAPVSVLEIFARLASDPGIEPARIAQLMELQERAEKRDAEKQFIAAFSRLKFPPIRKTAKGHNAPYAPWDEVQAVIDPILAAKHAAIVATGRSDYPNQINNVLAFPGIFRGLLDAGAYKITTATLIAAAQAIAECVKPEQLNASYIVPSVFDPHVATSVAAAVQRVAEAGK